MAAMKRLTLLALLAVAVLWPTAANAAVPCRDRIYNDWYADGKIASTYSLSCYQDAIKHVHSDAAIYSSLVDDIKSAMQAAKERMRGERVPAQVGKGHVGQNVAGVSTTKVITTRTQDGKTRPAPAPTTTLSASPTSSGGGGSGLPLPILVLGGVALLLVAVGLGGSGFRYYRRRGSA